MAKRAHSRTILTGYHAVHAALHNALRTGRFHRQSGGHVGGQLLICIGGGRAEELRALAEQQAIEVHVVTRREFEQRCGPLARQAALIIAGGVPALQPILERLHAGDVGQCAMGLLLDGVTDVGNIGAIVRSAEQFAADFVAVRRPARRSESHTTPEALARTSAGAVLRCPLWGYANLSRAISYLQEIGFWVYGADMSGEPIGEVDMDGRIALLLGDEGQGLARLTRERCDRLVAISTSGQGASLNVSAAAAILMYEVRRQQSFSYR